MRIGTATKGGDLHHRDTMLLDDAEPRGTLREKARLVKLRSGAGSVKRQQLAPVPSRLMGSDPGTGRARAEKFPPPRGGTAHGLVNFALYASNDRRSALSSGHREAHEQRPAVSQRGRLGGVMAASGHAFIAHTKSLSPGAQSKDGGYGPAPHPLAIRPGQRFWPRAARRREVLTVRRVASEHAMMDDPERGRGSVRVTLARLLAMRPDGQGLHYQFQGFAPRRYATCAYVWSVGKAEAVLCVPEWHPRRPVRLPLRLLPDDGRRPGTWLWVRSDLSASSAGRLQVAELVVWPEPRLERVEPPHIDAAPDPR